jgi:MoaA/NifB/PqqE/SkfB family radical SAM enzyme
MCIQHRHDSDPPIELPWYDPHREFPVDAWISLLEQVSKFRPYINMSGGEPMVYPGFAEVIQAIGKTSMPFEINTNGTLLAKYADMLVENGAVVVSISIDGPEEIHDHIRGQRGLFRRTVEGIEALVKARRRAHSPIPIVQLACTISKSNIGALDKLVPLAVGLKADIVRFQHTEFNTPANIEKHNHLLAEDKAKAFGINFLQPSVPDGEFYQSEIGPEDAALVRKSLRKAKQQAHGRIKVVLSPNISLDEIEPYYMDIDFPLSQHCHGLWSNLRIMPDGTFSPCLHVSVGNITEQPIKDLWKDTGIGASGVSFPRSFFRAVPAVVIAVFSLSCLQESTDVPGISEVIENEKNGLLI